VMERISRMLSSMDSVVLVVVRWDEWADAPSVWDQPAGRSTRKGAGWCGRPRRR
jgi:hypothetical protein